MKSANKASERIGLANKLIDKRQNIDLRKKII